jgi:uncharacterized protein (TIGR03545 family)
MEKGMEAIFDAKVNVYDFHLSLIRFSVGLNRITIADRDHPMKNLFETGRMEFRMRPAAVLRGKIYIEEMRADSLQFGTPRTVSGALPDKPAKQKPPKPKSDAPPLVDLKNFDAMGLLNREYDKLDTPRIYEQAVAFYNDTYSKYKGNVDLVQTRSKELQDKGQQLIANARSFSNIDYRNPQELERIRNFIVELNTMSDTVQTAVNEATGLVSGLETDIKGTEQLVKTAQTSINNDINHLKSYIDLGSGEALSALEPSIRELLSDTAEQYLDYGLRALEALEKLKASQDAKPKKEKPPKPPVFKGRDVAFPSRQYPKFFLGIFATDFTIQDWHNTFDLRGVSSNPDISGIPVTLIMDVSETGASLSREVGFKGSADFRTNASERFDAKVSGQGFPVSLGDQLKQAGIGGFKGDVNFTVNMTGRTNGGVSGGGSVGIAKAQLVDAVGTIAQAVDTAVREAGQVNLGIQYAHEPPAKDTFAITTNIGELIKSALKNIVDAYAKKAIDEIETLLRARIDQYLSKVKFGDKEVSFQSLQTEIDALFKLARGDKTALDTLKNSLDQRKTEFEQKIKDAAGQAVQQVKEEAKQQAGEAVKDLLEGKTPSAPTLPSLQNPFRR